MKKIIIFTLILQVFLCSNAIENTLFTIKDGKIKKITGEVFKIYISSGPKYKDFVMLETDKGSTFFMKREILPMHHSEYTYISKTDGDIYSLYHVFREEDEIEEDDLSTTIESWMIEFDLSDIISTEEVL